MPWQISKNEKLPSAVGDVSPYPPKSLFHVSMTPFTNALYNYIGSFFFFAVLPSLLPFIHKLFLYNNHV